MLLLIMMFNGLVCVDSDGSDFAKDSGSSCSGVCEQYYRNKLLATLEIIKNKEETIRVQGSSLLVAEARIASLTERATALRQELDQKARELEKLRSFAISCKVEKTDVAITAELQEVQNQKNVMGTLQDNLAVIAELYRECFYETAKQEEMIDLMRTSYHEVKLMDKEKTDKITRLQNVINRQKLSIEQCQDVVTEVENLKSEISSFMNSSNNDSGMWERGSESPDVGEELGDILDQLRQLQDMLSCDCTCGLQDENKTLKGKNENLEMRIKKSKQKLIEVENMVSSKKISDLRSLEDIEDQEREFQAIRRKIAELECENVERCASVETLTKQLEDSEVILRDTTAELVEEQSVRALQEDNTRRLQCRLQQADKLALESLKILEENGRLKSLLEESKAQVADLEKRLQGAYETCRHLQECCRDQHAQLQEAHARSATLCEESSSITAEMRVHIRRQKELVREQQEKIARQESKIAELQRSFDAKYTRSIRTVPDVTDPCCSKFLTPCPARTEATNYQFCSRNHHPSSGSGTTFSPCGLPFPRSVERESEIAGCAKCASNRHERLDRPSGSDLASCSSEPTPLPPRRQKKRLPCEDRCAGWFPGCPRSRSPPSFAPAPRASPADELLERVGHLHTALADGQRRWTKTPRR